MGVKPKGTCYRQQAFVCQLFRIRDKMKALSNIMIELGLSSPKDGSITVTKGCGPWIWQECV